MCTQVFPQAQVKIFLTASVAERARRRQQDLRERGQGEVSLVELEQSIAARDTIDSTREISPLKKAADAIEIISDNLSIEEVVETIVAMYRQVVNK
jgi:pantoate ligase / CMP/dCMP kinase